MLFERCSNAYELWEEAPCCAYIVSFPRMVIFIRSQMYFFFGLQLYSDVSVTHVVAEKRYFQRKEKHHPYLHVEQRRVANILPPETLLFVHFRNTSAQTIDSDDCQFQESLGHIVRISKHQSKTKETKRDSHTHTQFNHIHVHGIKLTSVSWIPF